MVREKQICKLLSTPEEFNVFCEYLTEKQKRWLSGSLQRHIDSSIDVNGVALLRLINEVLHVGEHNSSKLIQSSSVGFFAGKTEAAIAEMAIASSSSNMPEKPLTLISPK